MKLNTSDIDLRDLRLKLKRWGGWCQKIISWGLYYSEKSLLYTLIKGGGVIIKSTSKEVAPNNEEAENVNSLIEELGREKPDLAKVLTIHYVEESHFEDKVQRIGFSKRTYFRYLQQAEAWLLKRIY